MYGFFALMSFSRLEKLSLCVMVRRLVDDMLLPNKPNAVVGEMGLELGASSRPSRSSSASAMRLVSSNTKHVFDTHR